MTIFDQIEKEQLNEESLGVRCTCGCSLLLFEKEKPFEREASAFVSTMYYGGVRKRKEPVNFIFTKEDLKNFIARLSAAAFVVKAARPFCSEAFSLPVKLPCSRAQSKSGTLVCSAWDNATLSLSFYGTQKNRAKRQAPWSVCITLSQRDALVNGLKKYLN